jgi:hypothetical protein
MRENDLKDTIEMIQRQLLKDTELHLLNINDNYDYLAKVSMLLGRDGYKEYEQETKAINDLLVRTKNKLKEVV